MKSSSINNLYIILSIIIICLISSLLVFFVLSNIYNKGAGSEITDISNIIENKKCTAYIFSPNNPRSIFEEDKSIYSFNSKIKDKSFLLSKLNPIEFSNLDEIQKEKLFDNLNILIEENLIEKEEIFNNIIPSFQIVLSFLYSDSFAKSVISKSYGNDLYSIFYQNFIYLRKEYYRLKSDIIELLLYYFDKFKEKNINYRLISKIMIQKDYFIPKTKELKYNHQNAIDIFFKKVKKINKEEIGPNIYSFTSGVVVAAEDGWVGSTSFESYKGGGLSPKSGNGVIVFDPIGKRFILYFHLYKVNVKKGQIIKAGELIGSGGNTGINARKIGHGKHLHLEIYDIVKDRFLNCYELKRILFP
ncbi:MAG TPA: M23 family metallopeptidase [Exilispira sp.]|nr:M23 family metallopeptidase [Exilispira sp.]